jgi:transposase InsO family protein
MVKENKLWGAESIRGELLKLGIELSKRTIQKYMPKERNELGSSQTWATFLKNQANGIWACDFTVVSDWLFRQWYVFVVMKLKTRRIVTEYMEYFNEERPHQGIDQRIPDYYEAPKSKPTSGHVTSKSILGGLHHSYSRIIHLN